MTRTIRLAIVQAAFSENPHQNHEKIEAFTHSAANEGATIVLTPELFSGPYFCKTQDEANFSRAYPWSEHPAVLHFQPICKTLEITMPISIFEKQGPHYFNSLVWIGSNGKPLGLYRKSHIPDGPGYQEKFYFRPGDTGFQVFDVGDARIGAGICWDQWFPECARSLALAGAELLLYPTAIGAEPQDASLDTAARWRRAMIGHAVSNVVPVAAANRVGTEQGQSFYGTSFIADHTGEILAELDRSEEGYALAEFDLDAIATDRAAWGFFRDRREDLY